MLKVDILIEFIVYWCLKSLRTNICKYFIMMGAWSKEKAILRSQLLDLIYSQSSMIYKILPNAPQAQMDPLKETLGPHANGFINSTVSQVTRSMG